MPYSSGTGVPSMVLWEAGLSPLATSVTPEDCECRRDPPLTLIDKAQVRTISANQPETDLKSPQFGHWGPTECLLSADMCRG